jgi:hypothetical protein
METPITQEDEPIEEEAEFETTTQSELISCSFYAISSVVDLDTAMMGKLEQAMVKRIIKRSLRLIDTCIKELYDVEFGEDGE